ncbi:hypothetical protein [Consotaella salsifontis]|uniref:Uncharacterized protein n=1 Tax=Consotaella salsifontis TaxID=1365950 RepID=A0A1T4RW72_9HYPH|nr:hypothetical protein [Consotaella salsifontis]SKA20259.1 hypothetical protein SAMN05428963_10827 [Consotaella salsifontis]
MTEAIKQAREAPEPFADAWKHSENDYTASRPRLEPVTDPEAYVAVLSALTAIDAALSAEPGAGRVIELTLPEAPKGWPTATDQHRKQESFRWLPIVVARPTGVSDYLVLTPDGTQTIISDEDYEASVPMEPKPAREPDTDDLLAIAYQQGYAEGKARAKQPVAGEWIEWWQGSGPERGDHIMRLKPSGLGYAGEVAYIGDQHHDAAGAIVAAHNAAISAAEAEIAALKEAVERLKREKTAGAAEAFDALDVADRIIGHAYGTDTPAEWHRAYRKVARARAALGKGGSPE